MIDKKGLFLAVLMSAVLVGPSAMAGKKKPTPKQKFAMDVAAAQTSGTTPPSQPTSPPPPARPPDEMVSFKWINSNIINGGQYACAKCHGQGDENIDPTSYESVLQSSIIDSDTNAVPEDPNNSELYNAIAPPSSMPYDNSQNPVQLKEEYYGAVYWWIKAGAPND